MAASTVQQVHAVISGALSAAVQWYWIATTRLAERNGTDRCVRRPTGGVRRPADRRRSFRPPTTTGHPRVVGDDHRAPAVAAKDATRVLVALVARHALRSYCVLRADSQGVARPRALVHVTGSVRSPCSIRAHAPPNVVGHDLLVPKVIAERTTAGHEPDRSLLGPDDLGLGRLDRRL